MLRDLWLTDTEEQDSFGSLQLTLGSQLDLLAGEDISDAVLWIGRGGNYGSSPTNGCPGDDILCAAGALNDGDPPWTIADYTCNL